jgi:hypothetical protein
MEYTPDIIAKFVQSGIVSFEETNVFQMLVAEPEACFQAVQLLGILLEKGIITLEQSKLKEIALDQYTPGPSAYVEYLALEAIENAANAGSISVELSNSIKQEKKEIEISQPQSGEETLQQIISGSGSFGIEAYNRKYDDDELRQITNLIIKNAITIQSIYKLWPNSLAVQLIEYVSRTDKDAAAKIYSTNYENEQHQKSFWRWDPAVLAAFVEYNIVTFEQSQLLDHIDPLTSAAPAADQWVPAVLTALKNLVIKGAISLEQSKLQEISEGSFLVRSVDPDSAQSLAAKAIELIKLKDLTSRL